MHPRRRGVLSGSLIMQAFLSPILPETREIPTNHTRQRSPTFLQPPPITLHPRLLAARSASSGTFAYLALPPSDCPSADTLRTLRSYHGRATYSC